MKRNIMKDEQLELGLSQPAIRITIRRRGSGRAAWWFQQMRKAVDSAIDWPTAVARPTAQIPLPDGRRPSMV